MHQFVTVSLVLIFSLFAYLPVSAQLNPHSIECVDGYGPGSTEYKIIDDVFHIRLTPADEWSALPLPEGAPEDLNPERVGHGNLVYSHRVPDWELEERTDTFYFSTDNGQIWDSYVFEFNDVYTSLSVFGLAGSYLALRYSNNTFFPTWNSQWLNLENGELLPNGNFWGKWLIGIPPTDRFTILAIYEEPTSSMEIIPSSPTFSATTIFEYNSDIELQESYSVFNPWDYLDNDNIDPFSMDTHRIIHLEDRSLAATGLGLFIRHEGSEEWVHQEHDFFNQMRDVYPYEDQLYALVWNNNFGNISDVQLIKSTDDGETWAVHTSFEDDSRSRNFLVHNDELRFGVGTACYVMREGTNTPPEPDEVPSAITLDPAYPNPFNPSTTISFALPEALSVSLEVYNITGQRVAVLAQGLMQEGRHDLRFDASDLSSGIYMIHLQAGGESQLRKVTLLK